MPPEAKLTAPAESLRSWRVERLEKRRYPYLYRPPYFFRVNGGSVSVGLAADEDFKPVAPLDEGDLWGEWGASASRYCYDPQSEATVQFKGCDPERDCTPFQQVDLLTAMQETARRLNLEPPFLTWLRHAVPQVFGDVTSWPADVAVDFRRFADGDRIVAQGERPQYLWFVLSGHVRLGDVHDIGKRWEYVHGVVRPGQLFGELERPLEGDWIPTMLTATAGYEPLDYAEDLRGADAGGATVARILLKDVANFPSGMETRLSIHARRSYWSWWPMLRTVGAHRNDSRAAAAIMREVQRERLERIQASSELEATEPSGNAWLTQDFPVEIDLRDVLIAASGLCSKSDKRAKKGDKWVKNARDYGKEPIMRLHALNIVSFDVGTGGLQSTLDLLTSRTESGGTTKRGEIAKRFKAAWLVEQRVNATVHRPDVLDRVSVGVYGANRWKGAVGFSNELVSLFWDAAADRWVDAQGGNEGFGDDFRSTYLLPELAGELGDISNARVLDAGCGEGCVARWLIDQGAAAVVGVDVSAKLIEQATNFGSDNASFLVASLHQLTDGLRETRVEGDFDVAVCNLVLMDVLHYLEAITEIAKALKPGGKAVWTIVNPKLVLEHDAVERKEDSSGSCGWWLDPPDRQRPTYYSPVNGDDYEFAVLVQLEKGFPRTPYFQRQIETYESAFAEAGLDVLKSEGLPLPEALANEYGEALRRFDVEAPVHLFVTKKPSQTRPTPPSGKRGHRKK